MAAMTATDTVVGVFPTQERADQAIARLKSAGFRSDQIGFLARNPDGSARTATTSESATETGALTGAALGAAGGAAIGAGIMAGVIPVIGPVLAIGTLGTILLNAAGGAAAASLAGALIGWGFDDEDANFYEKEVHAGRHLVSVRAGNRAAEARQILDGLQGYDREGIRNNPIDV